MGASSKASLRVPVLAALCVTFFWLASLWLVGWVTR